MPWFSGGRRVGSLESATHRPSFDNQNQCALPQYLRYHRYLYCDTRARPTRDAMVPKYRIFGVVIRPSRRMAALIQTMVKNPQQPVAQENDCQNLVLFVCVTGSRRQQSCATQHHHGWLPSCCSDCHALSNDHNAPAATGRASSAL